MVLAAAAAYLLHALFAIHAHRALYGDTAWFLVRIISEGDVTSFYNDFASEFYYSRIFAYALTQLPTVLAARAGIDDPMVLSFVLGATFFSHKLVSLLACNLLLPAGRKIYIVFPLLGLFAGTINSEIYIVTETHLAISFLWPLMIAVTQVPNPSWRFFIGTSVAIALSSLVYESMAFFAPVMLGVVLLRATGADASRRCGWWWLAALMCLPIVISWMAILFPRDPTNKSAFTGGVLKLVHDSTQGLASLHVGPAVSVAAIAAVGALLLFDVRQTRAAWLPTAVLSLLLLLGPAAHFATYTNTTDFTNAITNRGFGGLMVQMLLIPMYLFAVATKPGARSLSHNAPHIAVLIAALSIGQVAWQILATHSWRVALDSASVVLDSKSGLVQCSPAVLETPAHVVPADKILCHWWVTPLSVLLAPDGRAQALLDSVEPFDPFDPRAPASLPSMTYAPVDFAPYVAAVTDGSTVKPGDSVSFTSTGRGAGMLRAGFSAPETWATWTDGAQAEMELCRPPEHEASSLALSFKLVPFLSDARPSLSVDVFARDRFLQQWRFVRGKEHVTRSLVLGTDAFDAGGCTRIVFKFDDARRASEMGAANDPRRLGVAVISMVVGRPGDP